MKRNLFLLSMAVSGMAHAQFSGTYAPANWSTIYYNTSNSTAPAAGSVNASGAPNSIVIAGPNSGTMMYANIRYTIPLSQASTVSFSYTINNTDVDGPGYDQFFWGVGNTRSDSVSNSGSGTASISVGAGQNFVLGVSARDDQQGPIYATISNLVVTTVPLPVKGSGLDIKISGTGNVLQWTTFSEENNEGFEIQKSFDAKDFFVIGFVPSKAASGHSKATLAYTFNDKELTQPVMYYRYRQVDHDGEESYSNVVIAKKTMVTTPRIWAVYPNPVTKTQSLSLNNREAGTLTLFDIKGTLVHTQSVQQQATVKLPEHLTAGTYFAVLTTAAGKQSSNLVIK